MAMLVKSYWDDSEDQVSQSFGVGGFVGPEEVWDSLEAKWLAALPKGITHFHATDCFTGNNEFEPAKGFPRAQRVELLDKLTDLICDANIKLICHAIDAPKYRDFAPKKFENEFLGNQYVACFSGNIETACSEYMEPLDHAQIETSALCAVFYEESRFSDSVGRCVRELRQNEQLPWRGRMGNATGGTKAGSAAIPLLQVGDLGAFLGTKFACGTQDGNIPWRPYFEKLQQAGRVLCAKRLDKNALSALYGLFGVLKKPEILDNVWNHDASA